MRCAGSGLINKYKLSSAEFEKFKDETECAVCNEKLPGYGNERVRDHDHISGEYRGAAHRACNLKLSLPDFAPLFIHNMMNYDLHLLELDLLEMGLRVSAIPRTNVKFISFSVYFPYKIGDKEKEFEIRLLDSYQFLPESLQQLAEDLPTKYGGNFDKTKAAFPETMHDLVCKKGVFPYAYVDSFEKLQEKELPPIERFYDHLKQKGCSEDEYKLCNRKCGN